MPRRTILVILGLDLGADDYVVKLFSLQEIVSRVRAEQPPDAAPPPPLNLGRERARRRHDRALYPAETNGARLFVGCAAPLTLFYLPHTSFRSSFIGW
jgi:hypothetical protein